MNCKILRTTTASEPARDTVKFACSFSQNNNYLYDMNKFKLITCNAALVIVCSCNPFYSSSVSFPTAVAHRGCWFKDLIPENSIAAVRMAGRYGYYGIECDVKYTSDSVMVLMHDKTINRTMRNASDYSEISKPVKVSETTFEDLRTKYVLASSRSEFRTPLPTLEEQLDACIQYGVTPMLHSKIPESYTLAQQKMSNDWICFSAEYDSIRTTRDYSACLILWDPGTNPVETTLAKLDSLGPPCGMSTMKNELMDADYIAPLKAAGCETQSSIWQTPFEMKAIHDGATIILSDWCWFPKGDRRPDDIWRFNRKKLSAGEHFRHYFPHAEFSAMTLTLTYQGTLEIVLNGEKTYAPVHATMDTERIGLRMNDTEPVIDIKALERTNLKCCQGCYYEF